MKRMICILALCLLLFCSIPVSGLEPDKATEMSSIESVEKASDDGLFYQDNAPEIIRELEKRTVYALINELYSIDITGIDMTYDDFLDFYSLCPYFARVCRTYDIDFENNCIYIVNPFTPDEGKEFIKIVNDKLAEVDELISDLDNDVDKALVIHDYLVLNTDYGYSDYESNTQYAEAHNCGGVIVNGKGVCQGYAYAYQYLTLRAGIKCYYMSSEQMNHAWNVIEIDGKYYHVDCTWDDPLNGRLGQVKHSNFLVSDYVMENKNNHYGWPKELYDCSDTIYDNAYWQGVENMIYIIDDNIYYLKDNNLYVKNDTGTKVLLENISSNTVGLVYKEGYLYYNTSYKIMRLSLDTYTVEEFYAPEITEGVLTGIKVEGEYIAYNITISQTDGRCTTTTYLAPVSTKVLIDKINLDIINNTISLGETLQLNPQIEPVYSSEELKWSSSNEKIATVDENGLITTHSVGSVIITVESNNAKATVDLTVTEPEYLLGDTNLDNKIDYNDAVVILQADSNSIKLTEAQIKAANVNGDNIVNYNDAVQILRYDAGMINDFE